MKQKSRYSLRASSLGIGGAGRGEGAVPPPPPPPPRAYKQANPGTSSDGLSLVLDINVDDVSCNWPVIGLQ